MREVNFDFSLGNVKRIGQFAGGPASLSQQAKKGLTLGQWLGHVNRARAVVAEKNDMIANMDAKIIFGVRGQLGRRDAR